MNIEKIEELAEVIIKVKLNVATPEQRELLNNWLYARDTNLKLYSKILTGDFLASKYMMEDENTELFNITQIKREIIEKITLNKRKGNFLKNSLRVASAAAAVVLLYFGGVLYDNINDQALLKQSFEERNKIASKIQPYSSGRKAILETDKGEKIELNAEIDAKIVNKSQELDMLAENSIKIPKNTISTPEGVTFNMTLADGTQLWLNENSKVTYPVQFGKDRREVEIDGEVYFEVKPNNEVPFYVKGSKSTIKVLGTKFNINSSNESTITTLVEGSVEVSSAKTKLIIKPSQQATVTDEIEVTEVDLGSIIAWKEGKYIFKSRNLSEIMDFLAKWYNLKIEYDQSVEKELKMTGVIFKFNTFAEVIEILEATQLVEVRMKGTETVKIFAK